MYQLQFDGFNPSRQYLVTCTAVASLAAEAPVIAEVLDGEARARYVAAGGPRRRPSWCGYASPT